jgi:uncharacterized protein (DUF1330 family)
MASRERTLRYGEEKILVDHPIPARIDRRSTITARSPRIHEPTRLEVDMPALVIVEIDVHDSAAYEGYRSLVPASVDAYGGRFIARGGATENLEGDWAPERIVVLEFPSLERAKQWWNSPEYSEAKSIRMRAARTRMIVTEGV